jgi:hypothetical protein
MTPGAIPQVLIFDVGGLRMGVLLAEVARLVYEGVLLPIPHAHSALAGILDDEAEDVTVPVFDLETFFWPERRLSEGLPGSTVAVFSTGLGQAGIRLVRQIGTRDQYRPAESGEAMALVEQIPAHVSSAFTIIAQAEDGPFVLFQPDNFWQQLDLLAPAKPTAEPP